MGLEKGHDMSDFKSIETQEELDKIIKARIARERERFSDYDELKKQLETLKEENTKLTSIVDENSEVKKQVSELQNQIKQFETEKLKTKIASEFGIPINIANRLSGEDEESIRTDAESLSSFFKPQAPLPNPEQSLNNEDKGLGEMLRHL